MLVKEVLVSSRRPRTYALRLGYLLALLIYSVVVINSETGRMPSGATILTGAATADAGKRIANSIAWFQFIAMQVVMAIMTITTISDEAKSRTLGVLLSTPMNHFQIVAGKLAAKLLNVSILLACSLPLLMLLRVMGGVPAQFIILSFGASLTTAMLVGAIVVGRGTASGLMRIVLVAIIILILGMMPGIFRVVSPYNFFGWLSSDLLSPTGTARLPGMFVLHAGLMLGISMILVWAAARRLKSMDIFKAPPVDGRALDSLSTAGALRNLDAYNRRFVPAAAGRDLIGGSARSPRRGSVKPARRVGDFPVFWQATRPRQFTPRLSVVALVVFVGLYYVIATLACFFDANMQAILLTILLSLLTGVLALLASATISSERQQRTWQVLLCSTMTRPRIVTEKLLGVLWRVRWLYLLIFVHLFAACCLGAIRVPVMVNLLLILAWTTIYALSSGLFFSAHCKTTLVATLVCICQLAFLWGLLPTIVGPLARTLCPENPAAFQQEAEAYLTASPMYAIYDSVHGMPGPKTNQWKFDPGVDGFAVTHSPENDLSRWYDITKRQTIQAGGYCVLGLVLAAVSISRFRRDRDR